MAVTNGTLIVNQAPVGQTKINWGTQTGLPTTIDFSTDVTDPAVDWATTSLQVSGNASIDLVGLLTVEGTFSLTQFDADPVAFGAGATGLALTLSASAELPGAGVSGTLQLVQVTSTAGLTWMGVEAPRT